MAWRQATYLQPPLYESGALLTEIVRSLPEGDNSVVRATRLDGLTTGHLPAWTDYGFNGLYGRVDTRGRGNDHTYPPKPAMALLREALGTEAGTVACRFAQVPFGVRPETLGVTQRYAAGNGDGDEHGMIPK